MITEHTIRILQGVDFEPFETDPEFAHPGLIIMALVFIAWAAAIGAGYAIYRAFEALTG